MDTEKIDTLLMIAERTGLFWVLIDKDGARLVWKKDVAAMIAE